MGTDRNGDAVRSVHLVWGTDPEGGDLGLMAVCGSRGAADAAIARLRRADDLKAAVEATTDRASTRFLADDPRPAKTDVPVPEAAPSQMKGETRSLFRGRMRAWRDRERAAATEAGGPLRAWSERWRTVLDAALRAEHGVTSAQASTLAGRVGAGYHVTTMPVEDDERRGGTPS